MKTRYEGIIFKPGDLETESLTLIKYLRFPVTRSSKLRMETALKMTEVAFIALSKGMKKLYFL